MNRRIVSLLGSVGIAASAQGVVNTRIDWQWSRDNVNWTTNYMEEPPGTTIYVRSLVSYIGTGSPLGLASLAFQPTVGNWDATGPTVDTLLPFVNGGQGGNTSVPPGVVTNTADPAQFGRVSPFGSLSLGSTNFLKGHTHTGGSGGAPAGDWLRIAQAQVTSWIGGAGNTTGGSGVRISQLNNVGRTTADPAFKSSLQNIEVFKYGLVLGDAFGRVFDSPLPGFGNLNTTTGEREIYWWGSMDEFTPSIRGTAVIGVPGPASLAVLAGAWVSLAARRRRIRLAISSARADT